MKLTFVYSDCRIGPCPTVYLTESGTLAMQGTLLGDVEGAKEVPAHEAIVELPLSVVREALRLIDQRAS